MQNLNPDEKVEALLKLVSKGEIDAIFGSFGIRLLRQVVEFGNITLTYVDLDPFAPLEPEFEEDPNCMYFYDEDRPVARLCLNVTPKPISQCQLLQIQLKQAIDTDNTVSIISIFLQMIENQCIDLPVFIGSDIFKR